jgi:hypothetical protein
MFQNHPEDDPYRVETYSWLTYLHKVTFLAVDNLLVFIPQHNRMNIVKIEDFPFRLLKRNLIEIRQVFTKMKYVDRWTQIQTEWRRTQMKTHD